MRRAGRTFGAVLAAAWIAIAVIGVGAIAAAPQAYAQAAAQSGGDTAGAAALSTKDLAALIKTLENKGERDAFLKTLKALLAARQVAEGGAKKEGGAGFLAGLSARAKTAANEIVAAAGALLKTRTFLRWVGVQWADPLKREKW
ncbi:MAG: hypothetical protein OEQ29_00245, partial [Alphaproteobacteria bacterium]|nr:hypothetical protein [Alphaproteobacteria bacterium]